MRGHDLAPHVFARTAAIFLYQTAALVVQLLPLSNDPVASASRECGSDPVFEQVQPDQKDEGASWMQGLLGACWGLVGFLVPPRLTPGYLTMGLCQY